MPRAVRKNRNPPPDLFEQRPHQDIRNALSKQARATTPAGRGRTQQMRFKGDRQRKATSASVTGRATQRQPNRPPEQTEVRQLSHRNESRSMQEAKNKRGQEPLKGSRPKVKQVHQHGEAVQGRLQPLLQQARGSTRTQVNA
eukprot:6483829-Amphidinium_carterae.1